MEGMLWLSCLELIWFNLLMVWRTVKTNSFHRFIRSTQCSVLTTILKTQKQHKFHKTSTFPEVLFLIRIYPHMVMHVSERHTQTHLFMTCTHTCTSRCIWLISLYPTRMKGALCMHPVNPTEPQSSVDPTPSYTATLTQTHTYVYTLVLPSRLSASKLIQNPEATRWPTPILH